MSAESKRAPIAISAAMRAVLDAVSEGVVVLDRDRKILFLNRHARQLLDWNGDDVAGVPCSDVLDTTDCEHNCPLTRLEQRGEAASGVELIYRGKAGREVVASSTFELLRDESDAVVGSVEVFRDLSELRRLESQLYGRRGLGRLVGKSCAMRQLYELVERAGAGVAPVLVTGESGAGKEVVARAIHDLDARVDGAFVPVNCAALGERAFERELAGEPRRARGRDQASAGDRGTLYLDEIDRLNARSQRVLLDWLVGDRLGDVRVVASTPRDIEAAVERDAFDRELFYALNTFAIHVPPLRERAEDVPLLVDHFVRTLNQESRTRYVESVTPEAMDVLCGHDFPGNVRELQHAIEHAYTRCRGKQIRLDHFPVSLTARAADAAAIEETDECDSVELLERDFMIKVCEENGWRLNSVAEQLGLSRTTLWRKLRRLNIENPRRGN